MSPEFRAIARLVDGAVLRARCAIAAECAAVGAFVAAWWAPGGLIAALAAAAWRSRAASRRSVVRALERANPRLNNLLVTADEVAAGALNLKPSLIDRVARDASRAAGAIDARPLVPRRRLAALGALAIAAWSAVAWIRVRTEPAGSAHELASPARRTTATESTDSPHVAVTIAPPAYIGGAARTLTDPAQIEAIENGRLRLEITSNATPIAVDVNGASRVPESIGNGFAIEEVVEQSGSIAIRANDGAMRVVAVTMVPDELPSVRMAVPGRDLIFADATPTIAFEARASDDFGLQSLALRLTRVSGSGEQFTFTDEEIPLALDKLDAKHWAGRASRSIAALGLAEGDMLVYRAAATDARPGGREATSDAFFIEISRLGGAAGDAFTLPEQETRYALSQQMLIVKTERLIARRTAVDRAALLEEAQGLAVEQRMIRSEFVFMLGGEVEDEAIEAQQSTELQEGRLANRGQSDLRAATIAMSRAEKLLTGASLEEALRSERAAVAALERAFARDRYILRALATRTELDLARRLTGVVSQPLGWRWTVISSPANRRVARLQGLLSGLGEAAAGARQGRDARRELGVLAEMAVEIDRESAALRKIAVDLQLEFDRWTTMTPAARSEALDAVVAAAVHEARQSVADPPALWSPR